MRIHLIPFHYLLTRHNLIQINELNKSFQYLNHNFIRFPFVNSIRILNSLSKPLDKSSWINNPIKCLQQFTNYLLNFLLDTKFLNKILHTYQLQKELRVLFLPWLLQGKQHYNNQFLESTTIWDILWFCWIFCYLEVAKLFVVLKKRSQD